MYRLTTAIHTFTLPVNVSNYKVIKVIYSQGAFRLTKTCRDGETSEGMTLDGNDVIISLTQKETGFFAPGRAWVQVRVLTTNGDADASRRFPIDIHQTTDEGVLE